MAVFRRMFSRAKKTSRVCLLEALETAGRSRGVLGRKWAGRQGKLLPELSGSPDRSNVYLPQTSLKNRGQVSGRLATVGRPDHRPMGNAFRQFLARVCELLEPVGIDYTLPAS
ncbi:hypothetical protein ElyMa_005874200 [Elysia marginata]|uniref:Uncharacterized protein n=1 Tax=Elysia marginata TaxID=1093978 RepID=A0AAV4G2N6_9GAST|nr:hypothetical protein ElyMa_005874200 [Elysia marginata]